MVNGSRERLGLGRGRETSIFLGLGEGICNLLASVKGRYDDEQSASGNDKAERAGRLVPFFVYNEGEDRHG